MKYLLLSLAVLVPVAALSIGLAPRADAKRRASFISRDHWLAVAIAGVALMVLTAIFDSLMIHADLFYYADELISGVRIGLAPIEDFAYPIAGVLLLPALWRMLIKPKPDSGESRVVDASGSQAVDASDLPAMGASGLPAMGASGSQAVDASDLPAMDASGSPASASGGPRMAIFAKLRALFWASRPVSWINTAYPFAAAVFLTHREIDALLVVGTLYYLIPYNLALYGINDVFDYQSDLRNPRKGSIEGALLPPEMHRLTLGAALVTNVPFLIVFVYLADPLALMLLAVSTFGLLAYSVPKLRFKERPLLDSIISSTHFVSPAVVGFALAGAQLTGAQVLILCAFFLWGMAAHAFGAVQDVMPDREAGLGSIATALGAKHTVRIALTLWTTAGVLMLFTPFPGPLGALIAVPYLINCAPYARIADEDAYLTSRAWRRFIGLNYFCGFLVTMLLIFAVRYGRRCARLGTNDATRAARTNNHFFAATPLVHLPVTQLVRLPGAPRVRLPVAPRVRLSDRIVQPFTAGSGKRLRVGQPIVSVVFLGAIVIYLTVWIALSWFLFPATAL